LVFQGPLEQIEKKDCDSTEPATTKAVHRSSGRGRA
jgi:hypothetical protein